MKKHTKYELDEILRIHLLWLKDDQSGKMADLSWANLSGADLSGSYLSRANLTNVQNDYLTSFFLCNVQKKGHTSHTKEPVE